MFPLHGKKQARITPYINYGLIGINVLVFLYELSLSNAQLDQFFQLYALIPQELTASFAGVVINQPVPEMATLFTSQFLHGSFFHLISNMVFLLILGNNIETRLGHFKYIIFYLTCGVLAALCQWFTAMDSTMPSLGASGAIFGVLGAYFIHSPRTLVRVLIGIFILKHVTSGVIDLQKAANTTIETGGVAYWANTTGFVFGLLLYPLLGLLNNNQQQE